MAKLTNAERAQMEQELVRFARNYNADSESRISLRNRQRAWDYRRADEEYHMRRLPWFAISIVMLVGAFALGYLALQVWAYTQTGRIYTSYFFPTLGVLAACFLVCIVIGKFARPMDRY